MKQYNQFERGSEWAKWDLHVHTPMSINQEYGGNQEDVWEKYVKDLENLPKEIKVIGVNDYLFVDGYEKLIKYKNDGRLTNIELLLPVIEFRLKIFAGNEDLNKINFHIVFSDKLSVENIRTKFLSQLKLKYDEISWNDAVDTVEKLEEFGKKWKEKAAKQNNDSDKKWGFNNATHSIEEIEKVLQNEKYIFYENSIPLFFTAIGRTEWSAMKWESAGSDKKEIINQRKFVFAASSNLSQFETCKDSLKKQGVNDFLLHCSDAHDFSERHHKENKTIKKHRGLGETFTWIKANPTFEGLCQIIFEPERARIQEEQPDKKELYNVIKSVRFIDKLGRFINETIYLNSSLNTIIGGKSTGKSLLLHFIAKTLLSKDDKRLFEEKKGKNDKIEIKEKYPFEDLDFEVEFADGKKLTLNNKSQLPNNTLIEFIPQQWLSDMVENHYKNGAESPYQKLIEKSLSEKPKYDETKKQHENKFKSFEQTLKSNLNDLFEIQETIKAFKKELAEMGNEKDFENSIQHLEQEITTLNTNSTLSVEDKQNFESLQKQKAANLQEIKTYENNIEALKSYKEKLETDWKKFVSEVNENYNTIVQTFGLSATNFLEPIKKSLDDLDNNFQENINQIDSQENDFIGKKEDLKKQKSENETALKNFEEKFTNFKKIEDCEKSILDYKQKIDKIQKQESSISIKKEALDTCQQNVKDAFKNLFEEYQNHIANLNKEYSVIFKADKDNKDQIELHSELGFDYDGFESNFLGNFNNKSTQKNKDIFEGECYENNKIKKEKYVEYATQIFDLLLSEKVNDLAFINNKTPKMAIESLFENRFQIDYKIKYENDWLENMSQGKKGIVLLKLYLAINKAHYPILIDQPEDNLDNRTIYTSLTDFIKKRKIDRQIIMVTHNANLVIATDAEQVIVANQTVLDDIDERTREKKSKFEYVTGALEHTKKKDTTIKDVLEQQGIREHVCEILEGGETAFKKREEKYGLK
jgi:ABC-type Mn2+/Zn2+ transport system ATPase subunit